MEREELLRHVIGTLKQKARIDYWRMNEGDSDPKEYKARRARQPPTNKGQGDK